ncbi:PRC-barrel domain-containing protein [Bradyrhizobium quebecense]|uniref:PRC-barrel domain-containing protein n=2 Tax=Bradyrhizobium quebecense TaxID=2748629 RepID=A0A939LJL3_9BRAD|nr:PRC-barrel domain-containing protein [Bradyrhizobium quebecense]UGA45259.1 PRC-barrel domain-containing protein [Bradyrhizobium quebecense]UGY01522.1 PRC-barrel domain-containing protein [Bradyrhizobium quebecense]
MRPRTMVMLVGAVLLTCAGVRAADDEAQAPPAIQAPPATPAPPAAAAPKEQAKEPSKEPSPPPSVTVIGARDAHGILGRDVRGSANEDMGRIVDVIVDRDGKVRAAVIDFGGFLGVGSRKIVVDWNALHFAGVSSKSDSITLDLNKQQVSAAPEYKEDTPLIVLGAAGSLHPWDYEH